MKLLRKPLKLIFCLVFVSGVILCAPKHFSQTPRNNSSSITGRVTLGGKAVPDIMVAATKTTDYQHRSIGQAKTDEDGNYRIDGLPAGQVRIIPVAKSFALANTKVGQSQGAQIINLAEGEVITNVDFQLLRGAVITGRITDPDGNPLVGEHVAVTGQNSQHEVWILDGRYRTDDRGVYRVYGLAAGEYTVSAGQDGHSGMGRVGSPFSKTFYPGTPKQSEAKVLELKEGAELANIDFSIVKAPTGFAVSGRVVDNAGQPVANLTIGYSPVEDRGNGMGNMNMTTTPTDANGAFRMEGIQPGNYAAFTLGGPAQAGSYSDLTKFEVSDKDVTGLVITLRPGVSISGVAVVDNSSDPAVIAGLQSLQMFAYSQTREMAAPSYAMSKILPDGSFSFAGLMPGKVRIGIQQFPKPAKGLNLARVEIDGMVQETVDVSAGADIKDVKLIFSHGTGTLRGQIKIEGGSLPEGTRIMIGLRQPGNTMQTYPRPVEVDSRGHFFADDIPPGTYEVTTHAIHTIGKRPRIAPATRSVTITTDVVSEVTIVLNLATETERP
ncbi:MAG TPA: carboxypeptidase-like regulatory domain-containing protein [Pyrinomonadaceae bacterium]